MSGTETALLSASLAKPQAQAQPVVTVAEDGAQRLVRFLDFGECSGVSAVKTDVRVAVAADLMAFVFHAADEIFVARDLLADEEERRVRAALLEPVKEGGGRLREGPSSKVSAMQRRSWDGAETATAWPSLAQEKQRARKVNKNSSKSAERRFKIITSASILRSRRTKKDQPV